MDQSQEQELDFFNLLQIFWGGKWILVTFVFLTTLFGFGYTQIVEPKYNVLVPYSYNLHSVSSKRIELAMLALLDNGWNKATDGSYLSITTKSPMDKNHYKKYFFNIDQLLTKKIYEEAAWEVAFIQTELNDALLNTEIVATDLLKAKRAIQSIDNGQSLMTFGDVSIMKVSPKVLPIVVISICLGITISFFFIFASHAIRERKELSANTQ